PASRSRAAWSVSLSSAPRAVDAVVAAGAQIRLLVDEALLGDLLRRGLGQAVAVLEVARHLELREPLLAVGREPFGRYRRPVDARLEHDVGLHLLAAARVGNADRRRLGDLVDLADHRLDLAGGDVLARAADHVLDAADDVVEAALVPAE